ncbi:hypothetical protein BJ742DRAFT_774549 [Cladochytrium replicatum]|nr:hypothetical protein BJ742DRAFT_774549 [Cladochytrium replicatum]
MQGICTYINDNGKTLRFRIEAQSSRSWIGFGINKGESGMSDAEIFVVEGDGTTVTLTHRYSTGYFLPPVIDEPLIVLQNATWANLNGMLIVTFDRIKQPPAGSVNVLSISPTASQNVIFAWGSRSFGYHGSNRVSSSAVLLTTRNAYSTQPVSTIPASNNTSNITSSGDWISPLRVSHGATMVAAWAVFAPASIIVARYFKSTLGIWWFRGHVALSGFGTVGCTIVGFGLALYVTGPNDHFGIDSTLGGTHKILGLTVFILVLLQLFLGTLIDRLFNPGRTSIPWYDKLHWSLGRVVALAGIANVWTGLFYYSQTFAVGFSNGWFYALGAWLVLVLMVKVFLEAKAVPDAHVQGDIVVEKATTKSENQPVSPNSTALDL